MKQMIKYAAAAAVAGMLAMGMAAPSYATGAFTLPGIQNAGPNNGPRSQAPRYAESGWSQPGYGAYDYAPATGRGMSPYSCAIDGTYGRRVDPVTCGS